MSKFYIIGNGIDLKVSNLNIAKRLVQKGEYVKMTLGNNRLIIKKVTIT